MQRSVCRKSLLRKSEPRRVNRATTHSGRTLGVAKTSFYQEIVSRGGKANVCVIRRLGGIRDVLMITPALDQLKADFPNLQLTFAIDMHSTSNNVYFELVKNAPFVNHLVDARFVDYSTYDVVVDISSVCLRYERQDLPAINRIDLFAKSMGIPRLVKKKPWYQIEAQEQQWARRALKSIVDQGKKVVVLHTASMDEKRCWPIDKYIDLVKQAGEEGLPIHFVILDFNNKYANWQQRSNCTEFSRTSLRQMAALIAAADLFIGPDSGPMHLAGALGTRSIVIFGSIPPQARINYYPSHEGVVLNGLSCLGCWYKPCPYNTKCMKDLDFLTVYKRMKELFNV